MSRPWTGLGLLIVFLCPPLSGQQAIEVTLPGGARLEMVWIGPGRFAMGSPTTETGRRDAESPPTPKTVEVGFYLGRYELTQAQWTSVMGTRPWRVSGTQRLRRDVVEDPRHPASYLSWDHTQALIRTLNDDAGGPVYRLPTEAEWEYACRAGSQTTWSFGDDPAPLGQYAWYAANTTAVGEAFPHAVGGKRPNPWGLYDLHGNVAEWCLEVFVPHGRTQPEIANARVIRGGGFFHEAARTRSAHRGQAFQGQGFSASGLRLVRIAPDATRVAPQTWGKIKTRR